MAVQVIKRGNHPRDEIHTATCSRCQSELQCFKEDMKLDTGNGANAVACPVCGNWITTWVGSGKFRKPDADGDSGK